MKRLEHVIFPNALVLLTWNYEDISILVPVVGPVAGGAVPNGKPQSLVRYQLRTEREREINSGMESDRRKFEW